MGKEKGQAKQQGQQRTQNTLSQVPNGFELIWRLREDSIYLMCLGVVFCSCIERDVWNDWMDMNEVVGGYL
jgi:hypothetical protein